MIKILFVCHGNICRSPMAEYILKDMAVRAGVADRFEIDSAAVSREEIGNPVYPAARRELGRHGVFCGDHTARQVTAADLRHFDRIYYMDSSNARLLRRLLPDDLEKILRRMLDGHGRPGLVGQNGVHTPFCPGQITLFVQWSSRWTKGPAGHADALRAALPRRGGRLRGDRQRAGRPGPCVPSARAAR